jgi:hypothetical protein
VFIGSEVRSKVRTNFEILRREVGSQFGQFWQWRPQSQIRSSDKGIALTEVTFHSDINLWDTDEFPYTSHSDPCFVLYNGPQLEQIAKCN